MLKIECIISFCILFTCMKRPWTKLWYVSLTFVNGFSFLRASAMLKHILSIGWTSVRPSERPSVRLSVRQSVSRCIKTAEHTRIVMLSSPHDSPFILVLWASRPSRNSDGVTPYGAPKQRCGMKMSQFSTKTRHRYIAISQKWLKIDGYMQRGVLQALNPPSIHVTFTAIVPVAYPGKA